MTLFAPRLGPLPLDNDEVTKDSTIFGFRSLSVWAGGLARTAPMNLPYHASHNANRIAWNAVK